MGLGACDRGLALGACIKEQKYFFTLAAGHGGQNPQTGKYTTAPAKMHHFKDFTFYEGVVNRQILAKLTELLEKAGIEFEVVSHQWQDNPLKERVEKINALHKQRKNVIHFDIHCNAANTAQPNFGKATGFEVFTSKGETASDAIAALLFVNLEKHIGYQLKGRKGEVNKALKGGFELDKEADFYMLTQTKCPSVLLECGFFTNEKEAKWLLTDKAQKELAQAVFDTILQLN